MLHPDLSNIFNVLVAYREVTKFDSKKTYGLVYIHRLQNFFEDFFFSSKMFYEEEKDIYSYEYCETKYEGVGPDKKV